DVTGDGLLGEIAVKGDGPDVELRAPAQDAFRLTLVGGCGGRDRTSGVLDGPGEGVGGGPGRGRCGWSVRAVEADDGVEVDDAASLVFGDLGEGEGQVVAQVPEGQAARL